MKHRIFTAIELLIAIAIILILAAMVLWGTRHASIRAKEADTIAIMEEFTTALEAFYEDYGYYPIPKHDGNDDDHAINFSDEAWKLFTNNEKNEKNRPYMEGIPNGILNDGFGRPLNYRYPGEHNTAKFDLWSLGHDRKDDADNLTNWKRN